MKTIALCLTLLCVLGASSLESQEEIVEKYNFYLDKINEKYGLNLTLISIGSWEGFDYTDFHFRNVDSMMMNEYGREDKCPMVIYELQTMNYVRVDIECVYFGLTYSFESLNIITDPKQLGDLTKKVESCLAKINEQNQGVQLKFNRSHFATIQTNYGLSYEMFAEIDENGQLVGCKINLWKQISMNYERMDVECGTEKRKYAFEERGVYAGGYVDLNGSELQTLSVKLPEIFDWLKKLHTDFKYTLKRVVSGKYQFINHIEYIVKHFIATAEVTDAANDVKQCHCEFYLNRFGQYRPFEIECGGKTFRYVPF